MAWRRPIFSEPMMVYWRIYASLVLNELNMVFCLRGFARSYDKTSYSTSRGSLVIHGRRDLAKYRGTSSVGNVPKSSNNRVCDDDICRPLLVYVTPHAMCLSWEIVINCKNIRSRYITRNKFKKNHVNAYIHTYTHTYMFHFGFRPGTVDSGLSN